MVIINGPHNKIGWCDYTWTIFTGCDGNVESGCYEYCYARALYKRFGWDFTPTFHPDRLEQPLKVETPSRIFVCSTSDIFADYVPVECFEAIMAVIRKADWHTFQLLTKCPENIPKWYKFPKNVWLGVTVTKESEHHRIFTLSSVDVVVRFVSFEPLLDYMDLRSEPPFKELVDWAIIGRQTGPKRESFNYEWLDTLLNQLVRNNIPYYLKEDMGLVKDFPKPRSRD